MTSELVQKRPSLTGSIAFDQWVVITAVARASVPHVNAKSHLLRPKLLAMMPQIGSVCDWKPTKRRMKSIQMLPSSFVGGSSSGMGPRIRKIEPKLATSMMATAKA